MTLGAGSDATIRFVDEVAAFQNALGELVALTAIDEDGDGRADDVALAVDRDATGPDAATVVAVLIDPVGLAPGAGAQDLVDSGNLVV